MANIYALLNTRAIDVLEEASKETTSHHPVVRAIIDRELGHASLATSRPQDSTEECVIKIEAQNPTRTAGELVQTPGVLRVAANLAALTA